MLMARYLIFNGKANRDWNRSQMRVNRDENGQGIKPKKQLLHAALRDSATTEEIIKLAAIIEPNQIREVDEQGNTPLHLCCFRESGCTEYTVYEEVGKKSFCSVY
jgi:ankyrin repeat protein